MTFGCFRSFTGFQNQVLEQLSGIMGITAAQEMAKSGGVNAALDNSKAIAKQIRILENRLDKAGSFGCVSFWRDLKNGVHLVDF